MLNTLYQETRECMLSILSNMKSKAFQILKFEEEGKFQYLQELPLVNAVLEDGTNPITKLRELEKQLENNYFGLHFYLSGFNDAVQGALISLDPIRGGLINYHNGEISEERMRSLLKNGYKNYRREESSATGYYADFEVKIFEYTSNKK